jgi:hypothetical protein
MGEHGRKPERPLYCGNESQFYRDWHLRHFENAAKQQLNGTVPYAWNSLKGNRDNFNVILTF